MKRMVACALAGLILLSSFLFLTTPFDVSAIVRVASYTIGINDPFTSSKLKTESKKSIRSEGSTLLHADSTDKYYLLKPTTVSKVEGVIVDDDENYIPLNTYSASFKCATLYEGLVEDEKKLSMDKTSFVLDLTLPQIETEYAIEARFRFGYYIDITEDGYTSKAGSSNDFLNISVSGDVTVLDMDEPLFNLKDGTRRISLCYRYSPENEAYLVTLYVDGATRFIDYPVYELIPRVPANEFVEFENYGIHSVDINGNNRTYGATYNEVDRIEYNYEEVGVYQPSSSNYPDAFDRSGVSRYSLAVDEVYLAFGTSLPKGQTDGAYGDFTARTGASIRPSESLSGAGLRFAFRLDRAWYDALTEGASEIELGAYIVPEDFLSDGILNSEIVDTLKASKELLQVTTTSISERPELTSESDCGFYASIVNLREYNYARAFRAIAYLTVDGITYYSSPTERYSINEVARDMAASGLLDGDYAVMKDLIVEAYLNTVLVLDESGDPVVTEGYTPPYTVSVDENRLVTLTATGTFDLDTLQTILIGDRLLNTEECEKTELDGRTVTLRFTP